MHHLSLMIAALAAPAVYAGCTDESGRPCYWQGRSPGCGVPSYTPGQTRDGNVLVASTENDSVSTLLEKHKITKGCYNDYGAGCIFGHKNLFCAIEGTEVDDHGESDHPTTAMSGSASPSASSKSGVSSYTYTYKFKANGALQIDVTFNSAKLKPCSFSVPYSPDKTAKDKLNALIKENCKL